MAYTVTHTEIESTFLLSLMLCLSLHNVLSFLVFLLTTTAWKTSHRLMDSLVRLSQMSIRFRHWGKRQGMNAHCRHCRRNFIFTFFFFGFVGLWGSHSLLGHVSGIEPRYIIQERRENEKIK